MTRFLGTVPDPLESELFARFREIERNFRERRWEPAELNGGKLSEVAYCILKGHVDGNFPQAASKPNNFYVACKALESAPASFGRSVRIQIPRMLTALYEIRNNRNVGHIGGDVDPNLMDAVCVLHMAKWTVSELIRIFHGIALVEASKIVEAMSERQIALVWDAGSRRRVLSDKLSMLEKTLVLLYSNISDMTESEIVESVEHSNPSVFRRDVLRKAHRQRLIEYNETNRTLKISPLGAKRVEKDILPGADV